MIRALIKKAHKAPLPLRLCDHTARRYCEPESKLLPQTECANTLILYFLSLYLFYISYSIYDILPLLKQRSISRFIVVFWGVVS